MPLFHSILCAVDFSEHSAQALRTAAGLAESQQGDLHLVTVVDPLLLQAAALHYDLDAAALETREDLAAFASDTLRGTAWQAAEADVHVATGRPVREILRVAEAVRADVIVLGTQGLGGVKKMVFGSTTSRVLASSGVAVLAVPLPREGHPAVPFAEPRTVLLSATLERDATPLAEAAAVLARDLRARLLIAHVDAPLQLAPRWSARTRQPAERRARAEATLQSLARIAAPVAAVETVLLAGDPASEIARVAEARAVSLVVVGMGAALPVVHRPGATAYRIVCGSPVPVLALPEESD
jgi:nucleotide-binding universal stress UspA family protein